jgi:hypothetical protein
LEEAAHWQRNVPRSCLRPLQVQIRNVRDVLSAGAHRRQLQQVLGFRTLLPVTEVSLQVLNVSSTAAGAAAAAKALDGAVAGAQQCTNMQTANLQQLWVRKCSLNSSRCC